MPNCIRQCQTVYINTCSCPTHDIQFHDIFVVFVSVILIRFVAFCFIITVIIFPSASVSTRTTKLGAGLLSTRETAIVMTETTIKGVPTMAATAAPKLWKEEP